MNRIEILQLREKPFFEIELLKNGFKVHNDTNNHDNGFYEFDKTNRVNFEKKRINWLVSMSSFIVDLFTGSGTGGIFKERNQLRFYYDNIEKRIILDDCDMKAAARALQKIKCQVR